MDPDGEAVSPERPLDRAGGSRGSYGGRGSGRHRPRTRARTGLCDRSVDRGFYRFRVAGFFSGGLGGTLVGIVAARGFGTGSDGVLRRERIDGRATQFLRKLLDDPGRDEVLGAADVADVEDLAGDRRGRYAK